MGLPSGSSRRGSRNKDPEDQDVPPDPKPQVTDGGTAGPSNAHTQTVRDDHDVQRVCDATTRPLRRELEDVREKINQFPMSTHEEMDKNIADLRREQKEFQQSQAAQMNSIIDSLRDFKHVSDEVSTLRRDTNGLLEVHSERARKVERPQYAEPDQKDHGVRRIKKEEPSDVDSDDYEDQAARHDDSDDDSEELLSTIPFFSRVKGPKHPGLTVIRPSDPDFDRLMNYRFYRLLLQNRRRDADAMLKAHSRLKAMAITLGE